MFTTLALAAALAAPVPKAAAPDLKWRFAKGDTFYVSAGMETSVAANGLPGGGAAQQNTSVAEYTYKVTVASADEKGTTLEVEFLSCKSGNGGNGVAAKLADDPNAVGQKLTFTLDAANKVTKADGKLNAAAGGLFSSEYVQSHVQDLFRAVPGKPLGKGETWKGEEEFELTEGMVNKRTDRGTVGGTEDGLTKLEVETDNAMVGGPKGGGINYNLTGDKGKRTVLFDAKAGRVRKLTEEYTVSGSITIGNLGGGGGGGPPPNITLSMTMKATVTVSDKEPKPGK